MKKRNLANLIIFLNALLIYFALVSLSVRSFHSCWDLYPGDPYGFCETEKEFFLKVIRRGSIYWTAISFLMLIIFLAVKESKDDRPKKTYIEQKTIMRQQEVIVSPSRSTPAYPNFCPECGSKIREVDQKFCINCGKELSDII